MSRCHGKWALEATWETAVELDEIDRLARKPARRIGHTTPLASFHATPSRVRGVADCAASDELVRKRFRIASKPKPFDLVHDGLYSYDKPITQFSLCYKRVA